MSNRHAAVVTRPSTPRAFTLLELLVVIGIIVVLVGILVPVASSMRRQARVSTTQQLIAAIDAAIAQYQSDARDWPGPFDRSVASPFQINPIGGGTTQQLKNAADGTVLNPTRSEELMLCVVGGLNITWVQASSGAAYTCGSFTYNAQDVGRGHKNLSMKNQRTYKSLMATGSSRSDGLATGPLIYQDSIIPEFVDSFETPIMYVRANKGASDVGTAYMASLRAETDRYRPAPAAGSPDDYPNTYLDSDTLPGQWRKKSDYILVSAGIDKKFGTADDLTNFGTPKMQ
jgi:prepilin-type N-terminal cleavage/methylation domain-containing protein